MRRAAILAALAKPGAYIEAVLWNGERRDRICDSRELRPWLRAPAAKDGAPVLCIARLRSFTVERLIDDGLIKQRFEYESGYRTFVLASVAKEP